VRRWPLGPSARQRGYQVVAIDPAAPEGAIFQPVSLAEFADPDIPAMRRELDLRFSERWFAWTPSLYHELGEALEREERKLIEVGSIQATGFLYVGERSGS
jgi:hypothetical protein